MKPQLPSTSALQTFVVVAQSLNISAASKTLFLTQGAVSKQIKNLETQLDKPLFHREARGLRLTAAGHELLPIAQEVIKTLTAFVEPPSTTINHINLCAPGCATSWVLSKIGTFNTEHADICVNLTSSYQHDDSKSLDDFDAKIVFGKALSSELYDYQCLFEECLIPVVSPVYLAAMSKPSPAPRVFLHAHSKKDDWARWQKKYGDGITGANTYFSTLEQVTQAALKGFGIGLCDCRLIQEELESQRLVIYSPETLLTGNEYYLMTEKVTSQSDRNEPIQQLCNILMAPSANQ